MRYQIPIQPRLQPRSTEQSPSSSVQRLPRPTKGLLFGMANVLYDATLWRRWLLQVLRRLGLHTNYRAFYHIWDHDYLVDVHKGRREFCEAFGSFLRAAGLSRAQIEEVKAACETRRKYWEAEARSLPGVKSTLFQLHAAGFQLAVLSDSEHTADVLRSRLEHLGLSGLFAAVVSSIDLGTTKPDPLAYATALREMNLTASETTFVGHDAEELAGAAQAGMTTVAFNFDPEAKADTYLSRFDELLDVVGVRTPYAAAG